LESKNHGTSTAVAQKMSDLFGCVVYGLGHDSGTAGNVRHIGNAMHSNLAERMYLYREKGERDSADASG
jgi:hypothetical protein